MKKHFLILLLSVITFCASSQVTIPDNVARFYLEQNEKVKTYEKIIPLKDSRISILEQKVTELKIIIGTHESDRKSLDGIIETKDGMIKFKDQQLEDANKNIKKLERQRNMAAGAGGGALIGSFFGPEGAVVGGVIGGAGGFIFSLFRKK